MGRPPVPLARPPRGYQPTQSRAEQNPPQSVSGVIPWDGRVTTQEAADALARVFTPEYAAAELASGVDFSIARYIDSSDGIAPCGYEEL